jgi:hypothetical protein
MIFLQDDESKQQFMVDTGAIYSILPHLSKATTTGPPLSGVDRKDIPCWRRIRRQRHLFARRRLQIHTQVRFLVRPRAAGRPSRGVSEAALQSENRRRGTTLQMRSCPLLHSADGTVLFALFPAIVANGKGKPSPKHKIRHTIETMGHPVFTKAHLNPDKLRQAEAEFRQLEAAGIICRSDSPWLSSPHMVCKKDGSWRPCSDYRRLNLVTTHDCYPLPSILNLSNKLHGCKFFSCIDLVKGYHQIPRAAQDIAKTAIITLFGLFEYLFMPFGLRNAAQTFLRFMNRLFKQLRFVFCYMDDSCPSYPR